MKNQIVTINGSNGEYTGCVNGVYYVSMYDGSIKKLNSTQAIECGILIRKQIDLEEQQLKALQRLAIESPQGNVKNYMEEVLKQHALLAALQKLQAEANPLAEASYLMDQDEQTN